MSPPRTKNITSLTSILNTAFNKKPGLKQQCRDSSKQFLDKNITNRVFTDFPSLITEEEMKTHVSWLTLIINDVSSHPLIPNGDMEGVLRVLTNENRYQMADHIRKLAFTGCRRLLSNSRVNNNIVTLLEWQTYRDKIDIGNLVSAYVGETLLDIFKIANSRGNIEFSAFNTVSDYISKHYREWVIEAIKQSGHIYEAKPTEDTSSNTQDALMLGLAALGAAAGSVILFAAAGIGYTLFSSSRNSSRSGSEREHPDKNPDSHHSRFLY